MMDSIAALCVGTLLGASLSLIGFTDYGELHRMLTFQDARMFLVFAGAVVGTGILLFGLRHVRSLPPRPFSPRVVVGGLLFGVGWAVTGACPGAAFAQLGEGKLWALCTLAGIGIGTAMAARFVPVTSANADCG